MYLVQLGRENFLPVDTLVEAMKIAICAYKYDWEVDIINTYTGEIMVSLRDGVDPYFSTSIHEIM